MAYDEGLAQRMREAIADTAGLEEKKMFGGIGFLIDGNMACGVHRDAMIVRVGPDEHADALARPHTRVFDITGRPMTGWVLVEPGGYESDQQLQGWVRRGVDFARSLPPK